MKRAWLLAAALAAPAAHAGVYTWTDAQDQVHYSDQPPPGVKAAPVAVPDDPVAVPASPATPGASGWAERELEFRRRQAGVAAEAERRAQAATRADAGRARCEGARARLQTLESGARVAAVNAAGEPVFLDATAREQALTDARAGVSAHCG